MHAKPYKQQFKSGQLCDGKPTAIHDSAYCPWGCTLCAHEHTHITNGKSPSPVHHRVSHCTRLDNWSPLVFGLYENRKMNNGKIIAFCQYMYCKCISKQLFSPQKCIGKIGDFGFHSFYFWPSFKWSTKKNRSHNHPHWNVRVTFTIPKINHFDRPHQPFFSFWICAKWIIFLCFNFFLMREIFETPRSIIKWLLVEIPINYWLCDICSHQAKNQLLFSTYKQQLFTAFAHVKSLISGCMCVSFSQEKIRKRYNLSENQIFSSDSCTLPISKAIGERCHLAQKLPLLMWTARKKNRRIPTNCPDFERI